jgi:hypothetical protein
MFIRTPSADGLTNVAKAQTGRFFRQFLNAASFGGTAGLVTGMMTLIHTPVLFVRFQIHCLAGDVLDYKPGNNNDNVWTLAVLRDFAWNLFFWIGCKWDDHHR